MELQILHIIQGWHQEWLDAVMIFFTTLGNSGFCWIVLSVVLVVFPRIRKCGLSMLAAMAITFIIGNLMMKNIFMRQRPFEVDTSVRLLIPAPRDYSFPSGHTSSSFTAATVLFCYYHRVGIVAFILAGVIAFSRMYFFVHYPTDILGGIVLGVLDACLVLQAVHAWEKRRAADV